MNWNKQENGTIKKGGQSLEPDPIYLSRTVLPGDAFVEEDPRRRRQLQALADLADDPGVQRDRLDAAGDVADALRDLGQQLLALPVERR